MQEMDFNKDHRQSNNTQKGEAFRQKVRAILDKHGCWVSKKELLIAPQGRYEDIFAKTWLGCPFLVSCKSGTGDAGRRLDTTIGAATMNRACPIALPIIAFWEFLPRAEWVSRQVETSPLIFLFITLDMPDWEEKLMFALAELNELWQRF